MQNPSAYLERVVKPAPDVMPERSSLLGQLEYAHPREYLLLLADGEAVGIYERAVYAI